MNAFALMFTEGSGGNTGSWLTLGLLAVMLVVMYFFTIRPQKKQEQAAKNMRSNLQVGDEITTIGGIVGTICAVKEQTIVIETGADRVRIEFTKWAISTKGTQGSENATPENPKKEKKEKKEKSED